jgi:cation-transporting ATPase 13A3/4/5
MSVIASPSGIKADERSFTEADFITHCKMHPQTDPDHDIQSIECYVRSDFKLILFIVLSILTGGFLLLFTWWFLRLRVALLYVKSTPKEATRLVIKTLYSEDLAEVVSDEDGRKFYHRFMPFVYDGGQFIPVFFETRVPYNEIVVSNGLKSKHIPKLQRQFGSCQIIVPLKSIPVLLVHEILHPFFVFQVFSVILWFAEDYVWYAIAIAVITTISLVSNLETTRRNMRKIVSMVHSAGTVKVVRDKTYVTIDQADLVPGDLMVVKPFTSMSCDAVLVQGNCVMEEGMLTGESVPVLKDSLPHLNTEYDIEKDKRFSLYEGTKVIQSRGPANGALALVTRTGYQTLKGKLVRVILFPKPTKFKFYRDSLLFILFLGIAAIVGYIVVIPSFLDQGLEAGDIVIHSLDLVTIAIPPALPTAMAAGITFALVRLSKKNIFCISPQRVNAAGKISTMIFDKTGTLTEDGMDLIGVLQSPNFTHLELKPEGKLLHAMATCHSLTKILGQTMGDTQDLRIFEATRAEIDVDEQNEHGLTTVRLNMLSEQEPDLSSSTALAEPCDLEIQRVHYFTSELKRMGVVVSSKESLTLYMKGAPEVLKDLCTDRSLPDEFDDILNDYTQRGYRVLACASKALESMSSEEIKALSLSEIEEDLTFQGLIVLQNKLKPETIPALDALREADIVVKMATGDNVLTGVAVGRECGIIPVEKDVYLCELEAAELKVTYIPYADLDAGKLESVKPIHVEGERPWKQAKNAYVLAATGEAFAFAVRENKDKVVDNLVMKGRVFARMAPEHKSLLIEQLQARNKLVGMCGDGANDCGALKTADIGISLCEAEASIAAPFTSRISNISCIPIVLREGRCSLAISLQEFKFMALYSMTQFTSVLILYWYGINLSDIQFLIEDLFIVLPLAIVLGYTGPAKVLSKQRPVGSLISVSVLGSVLVQTALIVITQAVSLEMVKAKSFYHEVDNSDAADDALPSELNYKWENSAVYVPGIFQLTAICYVLSISFPFKKPAYSNPYLTAWLVLWSAIILWLMIYPIDILRWIFVVKPFPWEFRLEMLALCFSYFIVAFMYEKFINQRLHNLHKKWKRTRKHRAKQAEKTS